MSRFAHGRYWPNVNAEHDPVTAEDLERYGLLSNEALASAVQDAVYDPEED